MEWGKKDLSESLDLTELENLFHARDDKTLASSKRCCVGVAVWVWLCGSDKGRTADFAVMV